MSDLSPLSGAKRKTSAPSEYFAFAPLADNCLPHLFGAAQTANHRDPKQIIVGQNGVSGSPQQPISEFVVGRFEIFLILNRLPLQMFLGDESALQIEASEFGLGLRAAPDLDQASGQVHRVVNAAIHTHATERIVDV